MCKLKRPQGLAMRTPAGGMSQGPEAETLREGECSEADRPRRVTPRRTHASGIQVR